MKLWRLSGADFATRLDGGYGLLNDGRWNVRGQAVTYCSTHPSLCILERLVHIEDPELMPDGLIMVEMEAPDEIGLHDIAIRRLEDGWRHNEAYTQSLGIELLTPNSAPVLRVPSVIVAYENATDRNLIVNHAHPDARRIRIITLHPFTFDTRL